MKLIRWYSLKGCPNCDSVRNFLLVNHVEAEEIEIGVDPILHGGIKAMTNNQLMAPVVWSLTTNDIIFGYDAPRLQDAINAINNLRGAGSATSNAAA